MNPPCHPLVASNTGNFRLRWYVAIHVDVELQQKPLERVADRVPLLLVVLHIVRVPRHRLAVHAC